MNTIGENIAALRKKRNLTQEALANLIGVSAQSVSKWENNTNMPDISLLPVIADFFACRIDDLFGRGKTAKKGEPERILGDCCENVLREIGSLMYDTESAEEFEGRMAEYKKNLKENDACRTMVMRSDGLAYYREKLGALLLKRPQGGWQSLLENEELGAFFGMLADSDFRRALAEICRSRIFNFTLGSLCGRCGIQDQARLEENMKESRLFRTKTVDVDGRQITIYEAVEARKLAMLFASLACAVEYRGYEEIYAGLYGCGMEELLEQPG